MRFGGSIFLAVVGAVLAFAVRDQFDAVDLTVVGYIMLAGGVLGIILSFLAGSRQNKVSSTATESVDARGNRVTQSEVTGGPTL